MRWWSTLLTVWLLGSSVALGQSDDWLVLPTTTETTTEWMQPTVRQVGRELRRQGIGVWSAGAAIARLEARGPVRPAELSDEQYAAWRAGATETVRLLAVGDYEGALPELKRSERFARGHLETLNRDDARAQAVLDTCLYLVRALLGSGDLERAEKQAQACVQASPGIEPTNFMHPPNVTELFEQAARPNPARSSTLLVESEPGGCTLRINGIAAGRTPTAIEGLYPGEYRVQVECEPDRVGKVHIVQLPPGSRTLFVIDSFDRAVDTTPVLHLRYDAPPGEQRLTRDSRELARALPASTTLVAAPADEDSLDLRLVRRGQLELASVRVPMIRSESSPPLLAKAITSLLAGVCGDFTGQAPIIIDCKTGEIVEEEVAPVAATRPPRGQFITGLTVASLGAASLLSAYGLDGARGSAGDDWINNPQSISAQTKWL
ncbi:MAG: PEGA domain-containing protein, partial [Myxococcota bacterium]